MKYLCKIIVEITIDAYNSFVYFIKSNLITFANILYLTAPYIMYFIGRYMANNEVGFEFFIPLAFIVVIYYLRSTANKIGKGMTVPVPDNRFTQVDEDSGEVSVENNRIQELLLYMADLEDWMERKGML